MNTIILIPAYKPDEALLQIASDLCDLGYEILIVDDGSGSDYDSVFQQVNQFGTVLRKKTNYGKGAALKTGFSYLLENRRDCQYVITADADGQHKPKDIARVAEKLAEGHPFVIGSRQFVGEVPARSLLGNSITRKVFKMVSGRSIQDTQTGLRGFDRSLFQWLSEIPGARYEYEMNMLLDGVKKKLDIIEVPIETVYENDNVSSHFHPFQDSAKIYKCILKYWFSKG
jgi:glycosyltransferase involved in cell wall biosynthesis